MFSLDGGCKWNAEANGLCYLWPIQKILGKAQSALPLGWDPERVFRFIKVSLQFCRCGSTEGLREIVMKSHCLCYGNTEKPTKRYLLIRTERRPYPKEITI